MIPKIAPIQMYHLLMKPCEMPMTTLVAAGSSAWPISLYMFSKVGMTFTSITAMTPIATTRMPIG